MVLHYRKIDATIKINPCKTKIKPGKTGGDQRSLKSDWQHLIGGVGHKLEPAFLRGFLEKLKAVMQFLSEVL